MRIRVFSRKALVFLLCAACLAVSFSVMAVAVPEGRDDTLTTVDARAILLHIVGVSPLSDSQTAKADTNGDGVLTSVDVRALLFSLLEEPTTTAPVVVSSTRPPQTTTVKSTSATVPYTTTTTDWDCISTTTTVGTTDTTRLPETTSTAPPTTLPYGDTVVFTVSASEEFVRAGKTFDVYVDVSKNHSLVGLQFEMAFDPDVMSLVAVNDEAYNPYATDLNPALFNDEAVWTFRSTHKGTLNGRYLSTAQTGNTQSGRLFKLTFLLADTAEHSTWIDMYVESILSCVNGYEYEPPYEAECGLIKIASSSTRPKTTTVGTTDSTYPPTTTTTWVLTGPDGTMPTTTLPTTAPWTTTDTMPDCISTTAYPTTLPYGDTVVFTVSASEEFVRAGKTFDVYVDVSKNHSLVGLQFEMAFDTDVMSLVAVNDEAYNPYATDLNPALFNDEAVWTFRSTHKGTLNGRYLSTAQTGNTQSGRLFKLTFLLADTAEHSTWLFMWIDSLHSCVNGFEYEPSYKTDGGQIKIASSTTRPKTTTVGTTDSTYPPTTTTTWVLTGPDGTMPTTYPTTTNTTYVWTTTTVWPLTTRKL